ncbi:MAG: hypothetical protein GQ559_11160, partial [Desulfobulbaceae bacterium]|nr:hypothetical protein [Desulfobulbaceae bacterium]
MLIRIYRISIFLTAFYLALFCSASADKKNNSIHINKLATSHLGTIQDNEMMLSLDDLIYIALKNNQMIEVVRQKPAQSQGQLTQARSGYLPHLALEGNYNYTHRKDSASSSGYENVATDVEQLVPD